jgi:hypothetical protein
MPMNIAKELGAVVALVGAMHIGKDDGAALGVMDGNELDSVGIGAPKAADPMDGPSGDSDVSAARSTVTASLACPDTAIKLPFLARRPKAGHHASRDACLLETENVDVLVGDHI